MRNFIQTVQSTNLTTAQNGVNTFLGSVPGATIIDISLQVVRNSNTVRVYTFTIFYKK